MSKRLPLQSQRPGDALVGPHRAPPREARRYVAAVIHHADWDALAACLASLRAQTLAPGATLVIDTGVDAARLAAVQVSFPEVRFEVRENRGWGAGVNRALAWTEAAGAPFALLLNPDVQLAPGYAEILVGELLADPRVAIAGGKLLRPDLVTLDSAGIRLPRHRRPRDRGGGTPDRGQFDARERIFGVSGAAMMVRQRAMAAIALAGEVVDEDFFAYHDDTDLCWRAGRFGWEVAYQPAARAVHVRGWRRERRREIEPAVRRHSFKNHYLQIVKNERVGDLLVNLPWLLVWEGLRLGFAVLRDPALLPGYPQALRGLPSAWRKRRELAARLRAGAGRPPACDARAIDPEP